jgi:hypothetical protein
MHGTLFFGTLKNDHMGRNIYYPTIFGHILNRKNQTFIKFGKILKEYFLKPRIGFLVFKNRSN